MSDMVATVPLSPPPGWASDDLSEFIELAHRNRFATFANKKEWYGRLSAIDAAFVVVAKDWLNPRPMVPALLFLRSHSAFRASCERALAGQIADLFPQVRACLEYAAYALHIHRHQGYEELWLRRHDNAATLKAARKAFHASDVAKTVAATNSAIGTVYDDLYQRSIDFGAHPNERSVTGNLSLNELVDRKEFLQIYLHGDGLHLTHALKTTAQAGVCALEILQDVYGPRFELLGVRAELLKMRRGL